MKSEIKMKGRYRVAVTRARKGVMSGLDVKTIVEYQVKEYINEGDEPFNDYELAMITMAMIAFN